MHQIYPPDMRSPQSTESRINTDVCASERVDGELSTGRMDPRVGSGRVGSGRVGSGRVGSGRVGSGRVGSGRVRSGHDFAGFWRVGSVLRNFQFFTDYFWIPESMWIFEYWFRIGGFSTILINDYSIKLNLTQNRILRYSRVGSDFLSEVAGRVNVLPVRVGSKKSDPWTTLCEWGCVGEIPAGKKGEFVKPDDSHFVVECWSTWLGGDMVTHLTKCDTNSSIKAATAQQSIFTPFSVWGSLYRLESHPKNPKTQNMAAV